VENEGREGDYELTSKIFISTFCLGDPGPCGYGLILKTSKGCKATSKAYRLTCVDRVEIRAAIAGLRAIEKDSQVVFYTLSSLTRDNWAKLIRTGFFHSTEAHLCVDLRQRFVYLLDRRQISFELVTGPQYRHVFEQCDQLAMKAVKQSDLRADHVFEAIHNQGKFKRKEPAIPCEETTDIRVSSANAIEIGDDDEEMFFNFNRESEYYVYSTADEDEWIVDELNYWDADDYERDYLEYPGEHND
jgi:ribonuclease HI